MNNEPVAWINEPYAIEAGFDNGDGTYCVLIKRLPLRTETHKDWKPHEKLLYTHPVKELTDDVAKYHYNKGHEDGRKLEVVKKITDEEIHQAIRRGFSREGFLSDGIFLEIKELLRNTQGVNSEQVPDFFFMENDLMGKR